MASLLAALVVAAPAVQDVPWPEFRGPTRDGRAIADLPLTWSEEHNVRWKTDLPGEAHSSPVVGEGRVWVTTATDAGRELWALAVDVETGDLLHERLVFEVEEPQRIRNRMNGHASPSPVLEPGRVWVHFGTAGTACLDASTGKTLWSRTDLECDHLEGPGSSPILFEDLLVFNVDGADVQYVVALDKTTGALRWRTNRSKALRSLEPALRKAYGTPIVMRVGGHDQLISTGARETVAYDPRSGLRLWGLAHPGFSMSSRAVVGDGRVFVNTGYERAELWAVAPPEDDGVEPRVVWKMEKRAPNMSSPVFFEGRLTLVADGGVVSRLDAATGAMLWQERVGGPYCASLLHVPGRVYLFDREGLGTVLSDGPAFEILSQNRLDAGCMASPAVCGDSLVLRTTESLYRIEEERP